MRFLCDEMLAGLGRWLRAAGYDTVIAEGGMTDRQLLERAIGDDRLLLSRDRHLMAFRNAAGRVILLQSEGVEGWARELTERLSVDWEHCPFSRCLLCNAPLEAADEALRATLPKGARGCSGPLSRCPMCDKLYWNGGHVRRMRARLQRFRLGTATASRSRISPAPASKGDTRGDPGD